MNRMRKALITAVALGALTVGGAAFAQAQNASSVVTPVVQQSQGQQTGEHGSQAEGPDSGSANEAKDVPEANDTPDAQDVPTANDTPDSGESDAGPANEVEDGN